MSRCFLTDKVCVSLILSLSQIALSCSAFLKKTDSAFSNRCQLPITTHLGVGLCSPRNTTMLSFCLLWDCTGLSLLSLRVWKTFFTCSHPLSLSLSVFHGNLWALRRKHVIDIDGKSGQCLGRWPVMGLYVNLLLVEKEVSLMRVERYTNSWIQGWVVKNQFNTVFI